MTTAGALPLLAAVFIAAACFVAARGVDAALNADQRRTRTRLDALAADGATPATSAGPRRPARPRQNGRLAAQLRADLRRAGLAWTVLDYLAVAAVAGAGTGLVTSVVTGSLLFAVVAAVGTAAVPPFLVQQRVSKRAAQLNGQVVQTIELIASSLRSGFGFMQSIEFAAREQSDPIAGELRAMIREIELGVSVDEALERLLARTRDGDLELVVSAVLVQRRVGGDLGEVLGNIASMIHDRMHIRGEIRTLTAQARLSAWIVGLLPVGLGGVMTLIQPSHMTILIDEPLGRVLIAGAVVLQAVGFAVVRRIAAIDY